MPIPLIMAGLSLLPKLPEIWSKVAGLFGKKTPSSITEAGKLAGDVMTALKADTVPPEISTKLEEMMNQHKEKMAEIALEEHRLAFENAAGMQNLEIESYKSGDEYVRRTRPMILRRLFYGCLGYAFFAPVMIIVATLAGVETALLTIVMGMVKYMGGWLLGVFASAYLGYAGARTLDKRSPSLKNENNLLGSITNFMVK